MQWHPCTQKGLHVAFTSWSIVSFDFHICTIDLLTSLSINLFEAIRRGRGDSIVETWSHYRCWGFTLFFRARIQRRYPYYQVIVANEQPVYTPEQRVNASLGGKYHVIYFSSPLNRVLYVNCGYISSFVSFFGRLLNNQDLGFRKRSWKVDVCDFIIYFTFPK